MTLALLCSGQGPQHAGMFAFTGNEPTVSGLFDHAARLLGTDPRDLVRGGASGAAHRNRNGQILCVLQALGAASVLADALPARRIVAGYSIGELAAWGVGGLIDPNGALDLAAVRAEAMDAASTAGDGLIFVRGLSRSVVDRLCEGAGAAVAIANPGEAFVLGGDAGALDHLAEAATKAGAANVVRIPVAVASHTPRLAKAVPRFEAALMAVATAPRIPSGLRLLSGIDAAPVIAVPVGLKKLASQIATTIDWAGCLAACVEAGATAFLELGPGRALAEMAAHAHPEIPARALDDFQTLDGVRNWLARHA